MGESLAFDKKKHFTVVRVESGWGQCGERLCGPRANSKDWMTRDLGKAAQLPNAATALVFGVKEAKWSMGSGKLMLWGWSVGSWRYGYRQRM